LTENLQLTLGIRRDQYSTVGSSTTPRGAIVFNPFKSSTLKLLYGEAFRAPNVNEVNYQSPAAGYKANPHLLPEKIRTLEAIWEQRLSDELFGSASLHDYEVKDLVDQSIDPTDSVKQFRNISTVRAKGFELELDARLQIGLRGYANYAYQYVTDAGTKSKLTNSPSHLLKLGLAYSVSKYIRAAVEMQYESERITVYGTTTNPYLLTNVNLSGETWLDFLKWSILGRNLLNVTYKTPGGFEHAQPSITQDGRNLTVKLEYKF
jgi:iron complex outermembrane receptor protein